MRHLFSREGTAALRRFARPDTLLGLDYDGTLAAIRRRPEQAQLADATRKLLARVSQRYPTVVITGRAKRDITRLLKGLPDIEIIGNHGAEGVKAPPRAVQSRVETWRRRLREHLPATDGLLLEDKRYLLSLHYRTCRDPEAVRAAIMAAAERLPGARIVAGKAVVNLVPAEAPHKGTALLEACARLGSPRAIYIGDDVTDEDVFALGRPQRLLGVRVGHARGSAARYYLRDRRELRELLRQLLAAA